MKIGSEVFVVRQTGNWKTSYNDEWWDHWDHHTDEARVISFDAECVCIWINGKVAFEKPEDVFETIEQATARAEAINLKEFGHKGGRWEAERLGIEPPS